MKKDTFKSSDPMLEASGLFLPLLPLKSVVILPKSILPVFVGRPSSIKAVEYAIKNGNEIFITTQKDSAVESPGADDVFACGTRATILQVMRMPNGAIKILAEGVCRALISDVYQENGFMGGSVDDLPTTGLEDDVEVEALWRQLKDLYNAYGKLNEKAPLEILHNVKTPTDIDYAVDTITTHISNLSFTDRQQILELNHLPQRILRLCSFLRKEIEILETEQRIRSQVQTQVEKSQKEYYLTEQIKAIHKELGRDDNTLELEQLSAKIRTIGASTDAIEKVDKEIKRLEQMPPLSSEAVVSRHYVDWLTSLPWKTTTKDDISIVQAERILDKHHAGLKKAKERIIEFLAAKKYAKNLERSPIICLAGPPGVGKTSLAKSIALSLGREFIRISLGGVKDEAEIRGHRRTYIGALPGKIIQAMKKAKVINPVILLDEIDKMGRDMQGDPASALLEVLDPEQNKTFVDHFLDLEYDLSKVIFITTANYIDGIPYPLFDRMEIVNLAGYTEEEKVSIAHEFLIPKGLKEYSLTARQFKISQPILHKLVNDYTKEAGVRQLERVITKLMRKTIQVLLKDSTVKSVTITNDLLKEWLGNSKYKKTSLNPQKELVGVVTGLAWTEMGGDVLEIETSVLPGKGTLTLTGQLGEVMQESVQAGLSYIRSRAHELGLKSSFHSTKDIHVHMPEGATPKDGPSAGITICTALISALTNVPVNPNIAMTGEVTLRGRVLMVGGLKEKILAAKQHGIGTVILPSENLDDDEVQEIIKENEKEKNLNLVFVRTMDEVLQAAFAPGSFKKKTAPSSTKKTKKPAKKTVAKEKETDASATKASKKRKTKK